MLTEDQKVSRMTTAATSPDRYQNEDEAFLHRIVACKPQPSTRRPNGLDKEICYRLL